MKALVTGSAGFIGSHLTDYLIEKGHTVIGIDNYSTGYKKNKNSKATYYDDDIRDLDAMRIIFDLEKPDWVFHNAANPRTFLSVAKPHLDMRININGTLNVLLAARDAKVKRFIFASSCILNAPKTPYYVSKLAGEEYTRIFHDLYGLSTISLRYSNVYGSLRQSEKGTHLNVLASLHKSKKETGRIWITGDGTQARDWTHVTDIARANLLAAESDCTGKYDICTGIETSMNEIAEYFDCPIDYIADQPGDSKSLSSKQNQYSAKKAFGYEYEIALDAKSLKPYTEV